VESIEFQFGHFKTAIHVAAGKNISERLPDKRMVKVYDPVTDRLFGLPNERKVVIPQGEQEKRWETAEQIFRCALRAGLGRDGYIVGIGGGLLCDLAAFAASTYMRGCRLVLVPTTLLAMVDAAIGGKTGFNYMGLKNMIGTFYPADAVYLFPDVLETLPDREFLCGIAETIKHACLGDPLLLELLEKKREDILGRRKETLQEMVKKSVLVKCGIVERDLTEQGERAFLNFGHTFGHALESVLGFSESRHGEAVAWGMVKAMELGKRIGLTEPEYARRVVKLIAEYGFPLHYKVPVDQFLHAAAGDKKKREGTVRFVLQKNLGETVLLPVESELLRELLAP
jgi:3-dehydroquinate synthase